MTSLDCTTTAPLTAHYNDTTHQYEAVDTAGTVHGAGWTHADALVAAGEPLPPAFPAAVDLTPVDFLARCADGEFVRDWAMIDHLAALVRCALRDTLPLSAPPLPSPDAPAGGDSSPASPRCEVAGCDAPGAETWVGCVPRYPVTLCDAHQQGRA